MRNNPLSQLVPLYSPTEPSIAAADDERETRGKGVCTAFGLSYRRFGRSSLTEGEQWDDGVCTAFGRSYRRFGLSYRRYGREPPNKKLKGHRTANR